MYSSASIINTRTGWNCILLALLNLIGQHKNGHNQRTHSLGLLGETLLVVLFKQGRAIVEPGPHALSHGGPLLDKHMGFSAQQLDAKSWEATRVFAFTSQGFRLSLLEHENSKTRLTSLQISLKPPSHSIPTKHPIMFSVSHSPKAANDCSLYQTTNAHGSLQANKPISQSCS